MDWVRGAETIMRKLDAWWDHSRHSMPEDEAHAMGGVVTLARGLLVLPRPMAQVPTQLEWVVLGGGKPWLLDPDATALPRCVTGAIPAQGDKVRHAGQVYAITSRDWRWGAGATTVRLWLQLLVPEK